MTIIKSIHVLCAALSICGFTARGITRLVKPQALTKKWIKIAPHIIDTLLLVTAIILVIQSGFYPTTHAWVTAKIIALVAYILLGMITLRFGRNNFQVSVSFVAALLCFAYIVSVAETKLVWPF